MSDPIQTALEQLSVYDRVKFVLVVAGKARIATSAGDAHRDFSANELPPLLSSFQEDRELFLSFQQAGTQEVDVPSDICFSFLDGGRFIETLEARPEDGRPCVQASGKFYITKRRFAISDIITSYDELIAEFESAIRAVTSRFAPEIGGADLG